MLCLSKVAPCCFTSSASRGTARVTGIAEPPSFVKNTSRKHTLNLCNDASMETLCRQQINILKSPGLPIVHHPGYTDDTIKPNHRFTIGKNRAVMRCLLADNIVDSKQVVHPHEISIATATRVHTEDYIHRFFTGKLSRKEQRKCGFTWTPGLVRRSRLAAGGTLLGSRLAMERGLACSTGGGTHHAFADHGTGYCPINDMAIAAKHLLHSNRVDRVLIVDLDVHQGDGTAAIFAKDDCVFTFSMHCGDNFPFKKQLSDLDISLEAGTEDAAYLSVLAEYLPGILNSFRPDLILYDAGVDPHHRDELGKLKLSDQGLYERDYYVIDAAVSRGIPCMAVIGGGYSFDIDELSQRHTMVHRAAAKIWSRKMAR